MTHLLFVSREDEVYKNFKNCFKSIYPGKTIVHISGEKLINNPNPYSAEAIVFTSSILKDIPTSTIKKLKTERKTSQVPLLLIANAKSNKHTVTNSLEKGIDSIIIFPVSEVELEFQLRSFIQKSSDKLTEKKSYSGLTNDGARHIANEEQDKIIEIIHNDSPVNIWIINVEKNGKFRFVYQNKQAQKSGRIPNDFLIGKTTDSLVPEIISRKIEQKLLNIIQDVITTKASVSQQEKVEVKGIETWWSTTFSPITNTAGEVTKILISSILITEQKQTEKLLEEKERNYRNLFEDNPQPMWIYDKETLKFLKVNKAATELYGYSEEEFLTMKITQLFAPDEHSKLMHHLKLSKDSYRYLTEWNHLKKNGEKFFVETSSYKIDFEGCQARYVLIKDITESKQVYRALQEKNESLKHAQEIAKMGSWQYDLINKKASWSENNYRIYGLEPNEIKPTWDYALSRIHHEDLPKIHALYQNINRIKEPVNTEFRLLFKDGSVKWIQNNSIPQFEDGKLAKINGVNIDITSRKETEQQLIEAKEKAQESDRLKSAFLANMSHEIRTPMSGIIGFLDLIHAPGTTQEEEQLYYKMVKNSSNRLLNTINDIVEMSKIESGQLKIYPDLIDIQNEFLFLKNFFEPEARDKNIELKLVLSQNNQPDLLLSDKIKFRSIITNLIKNAIKFTSEGLVEFGYQKADDSYLFFVKDTGVGIPKNRIDAIFDRFVQANLNISRDHEGSGLGLSIARAYTELLGGKIWVESEENNGSKFFFSLKNDKKINKQTEQIFPNKYSTEINLDKKGIKILIAEDDDINWAFLNALFKKKNFITFRAKNGYEAIEAIKNNTSINLILMDIKMPEMDGIKATRLIRKFNRKIPVIALTAYSFSDNYETIIDAGCNDFLSKPINTDELFTKIKNNLLITTK